MAINDLCKVIPKSRSVFQFIDGSDAIDGAQEKTNKYRDKKYNKTKKLNILLLEVNMKNFSSLYLMVKSQ